MCKNLKPSRLASVKTDIANGRDSYSMGSQPKRRILQDCELTYVFGLAEETPASLDRRDSIVRTPHVKPAGAMDARVDM